MSFVHSDIEIGLNGSYELHLFMGLIESTQKMSSASSNHHATKSSPSIFRNDQDYRREQNTVKFADRMGEVPADTNPNRNNFGGHPEGTIYQEIVLNSDDKRPRPVDHHSSSQKSSISASSSSDAEQCNKFCGVNSVCRTLLGRAVCG